MLLPLLQDFPIVGLILAVAFLYPILKNQYEKMIDRILDENDKNNA